MSHQAGVTTAKLYKGAIDEVISGVREAFLDEGIDEQILQELKQTWEAKVLATKAVNTLSDQVAASASTSSSSNAHNRSHHSSSHSSSSAAGSSSNAAAVNRSNATNVNRTNATNVIQTAPSASVMVAAGPAISNLGTATAAAGGCKIPHLAAHQVYQQNTVPGMAAASGFTTFHQGILAAGTGQGLIIPGVRFAQLPTIPAIPTQLMQLNQNRTNAESSQNGTLPQVDGPAGISDDEDDFADDDDAQETVEEAADAGGVEEGEPLNSEDDVSNEDAAEMFEADNVVVCQYEKVTRTRNKWKFVLKDGVMNLDGKDYVFNRANGEAEF